LPSRKKGSELSCFAAGKWEGEWWFVELKTRKGGMPFPRVSLMWGKKLEDCEKVGAGTKPLASKASGKE